MDKEFRKLILASSGNSFTLYLEMIISFTIFFIFLLKISFFYFYNLLIFLLKISFFYFYNLLIF